jgi:hypothetical protein
MKVEKKSRTLQELEKLWSKSNELEYCIRKLPGSVLQAALLYQDTQIILKEDKVVIIIPDVFSSVVLSNIRELKKAFNKPVIIEIKEEQR